MIVYCILLSNFYYKYCSIKSTGLIECTGFLLRVLVLSFSKVLTAKSTVSIKSTGFRILFIIGVCVWEYWCLELSGLLLTARNDIYFTQSCEQRLEIVIKFILVISTLVLYWFSIKSTGLRIFGTSWMLSVLFLLTVLVWKFSKNFY